MYSSYLVKIPYAPLRVDILPQFLRHLLFRRRLRDHETAVERAWLVSDRWLATVAPVSFFIYLSHVKDLYGI